jgi:hypothetical protein
MGTRQVRIAQHYRLYFQIQRNSRRGLLMKPGDLTTYLLRRPPRHFHEIAGQLPNKLASQSSQQRFQRIHRQLRRVPGSLRQPSHRSHQLFPAHLARFFNGFAFD